MHMFGVKWMEYLCEDVYSIKWMERLYEDMYSIKLKKIQLELEV